MTAKRKVTIWQATSTLTPWTMMKLNRRRLAP